MRISGTYFNADGTVGPVCSVLTSTDDQSGIDAAIKEQWPVDGAGVPIPGVTGVALASGGARTNYAQRPA